MSHLMVVAAGTGGHVMPGLAVAEALQARGWTVSWLGTATGMERGLVEPRGLPFDAVNFAGLRGKGLRTMLVGGFALLRALWQSRAAVRSRRPRVVFSTGGYVAVPAGLAASLAGVPTLEIVRLEAVAEEVAASGVAAERYPSAFTEALTVRAAANPP